LEFNPSLGTNGEWAWMGGSSTNYRLPECTVRRERLPPETSRRPNWRSQLDRQQRPSLALWRRRLRRQRNFRIAQRPLGVQSFHQRMGLDGGSSTVGVFDGQLGVYGTLGTRATGNVPGGRYSAVSWTDNGGNLWLFGAVATMPTTIRAISTTCGSISLLLHPRRRRLRSRPYPRRILRLWRVCDFDRFGLFQRWRAANGENVTFLGAQHLWERRS